MEFLNLAQTFLINLYNPFLHSILYLQKKAKPIGFIVLICIIYLFLCESCTKKPDGTEQMIKLLAEANVIFKSRENKFSSEGELESLDAKLQTNLSTMEQMQATYDKSHVLLNLGKETEAINILNFIINKMDDPYNKNVVVFMQTLALANMRLGERQNCITNHSVESCIVPIRGNGIHTDKTGSRAAIDIYKNILSKFPEDYESRWLLNIAYMTLGEYPDKVPKELLVPGLDKDQSGSVPVKPFLDLAPALGLNLKNNSGGVIVEDMNNDGYLDVVISDWRLDKGMHYFINDKQGGFIDVSEKSGLSKLNGGLNLLVADYDNDGDPDIFVLRGAWCKKFGRQPNSLIRNNGDDTFTDVTIESGLLSKHPTQTGQWRDFNNDGWIDLYIGNESSDLFDTDPCELYINNKNGTFTEVAEKAGCQAKDFIKGVACGDYNNDGLMDIFISSWRGTRVLYKNTGNKDNIPQFKNVTQEAGLNDIKMESFPTWFWDYNNDGWMDIFVCGYAFGKSVAYTMCTEALGIPNQSCYMYLYRNNKDGTFTNVSKEAGLNKTVYAMGSNFGDIDNDGYLDMYLGTGNPEYNALVPNRLFKNMTNGTFADITIPARVGNLQKGHGVAIADIDNDGDEDIFIEMGGAFFGDRYNNSLYINPGQNKNNWINIRLTGTETNRSAIGTRLKVSFKENGIQRSVYREVNSGGSFGCSTLRREIGIGHADMIDEIEITWQKTQKVQVLKNIKPNQFITLKEGDKDYKVIELKDLNFIGDSSKIVLCKPSSL